MVGPAATAVHGSEPGSRCRHGAGECPLWPWLPWCNRHPLRRSSRGFHRLEPALYSSELRVLVPQEPVLAAARPHHSRAVQGLSRLWVEALVDAAVTLVRLENKPDLLVDVAPALVHVFAVEIEFVGADGIERKVDDADHQRHAHPAASVRVQVDADALQVNDAQRVREPAQKTVGTARAAVRRLNDEVNVVRVSKLLAVHLQRPARAVGTHVGG
jgi:hypothetical protein